MVQFSSAGAESLDLRCLSVATGDRCIAVFAFLIQILVRLSQAHHTQ